MKSRCPHGHSSEPLPELTENQRNPLFCPGCGQPTTDWKPVLQAKSAKRTVLAIALGAALLGHAASAATSPADQSPLGKIKTIVVIYAENRSFDNLYGLFPGAEGIAQALENPASYQQLDRDGKTVLPNLPPVHATHAMGAKIEERWAFVGKLPNKPFRIDAVQPGGEPGISAAELSPDLVHRFYNNQMQIHGGRNDRFAAWSSAGGLTMGYYSGKSMKMWQLARQYQGDWLNQPLFKELQGFLRFS